MSATLYMSSAISVVACGGLVMVVVSKSLVRWRDKLKSGQKDLNQEGTGRGGVVKRLATSFHTRRVSDCSSRLCENVS